MPPCRHSMAMTQKARLRSPSMGCRATRRAATRMPSSCTSVSRPMPDWSAPPAVSSTCSRAAAQLSRRSSSCSCAWSRCSAASQTKPSRPIGRRSGGRRSKGAPGRGAGSTRHDEGIRAARGVSARPTALPRRTGDSCKPDRSGRHAGTAMTMADVSDQTDTGGARMRRCALTLGVALLIALGSGRSLAPADDAPPPPPLPTPLEALFQPLREMLRPRPCRRSSATRT